MGFIVLGIVVLLLVLVISAYNGFIVLRNKTDEAYATMDVYLKKRYDLVPNLVETVKGYATHEKETLEHVIQARNMAITAKDIPERQERENALTGTLKSLFALSESYPMLKADSSFLNLQNQLSQLETDISQSRKYYNGVVKAFNTKVELFPSNILAGIFNFKKYQYFMADASERDNVKVSF